MKPKEYLALLNADKFERAEKCFKKLQAQDYKLCFQNGSEILSYEQIKNLGIDVPNLDLPEYRKYCLDEFRDNGVVECNTLPPTKESVETQPCHEDKVESLVEPVETSKEL